MEEIQNWTPCTLIIFHESNLMKCACQSNINPEKDNLQSASLGTIFTKYAISLSHRQDQKQRSHQNHVGPLLIKTVDLVEFQLI